MHLFRIHPATGTGTDLLSTDVGGVRRHRESIGHNRSPGFRSRPSRLRSPSVLSANSSRFLPPAAGKSVPRSKARPSNINAASRRPRELERRRVCGERDGYIVILSPPRINKPEESSSSRRNKSSRISSVWKIDLPPALRLRKSTLLEFFNDSWGGVDEIGDRSRDRSVCEGRLGRRIELDRFSLVPTRIGRFRARHRMNVFNGVSLGRESYEIQFPASINPPLADSARFYLVDC